MNVRHGWTALLVAAALPLGAAPLHAQDGAMRHAEGFDASRAMLSDAPMFDPYYVSDVEPLREALRDRVVGDDTPLLVVQRGGQTLALLTYQMAYHHVAQGELAGEPWMVAF